MTQMANSSLTDRIDDLQRARRAGAPAWSARATVAAASATVRLTRVGRLAKPADRPVPRQAADREDDTVPRPLGPLLSGLHSQRTPVVYVIDGDGAGTSIRLGTWSTRPGNERLDGRLRMLTGLVRGACPGAVVQPDPVPAVSLPRVGYVLGVPRTSRSLDGAAADALIAGMRGHRWRVVLLAQPAAIELRDLHRAAVLRELRATESGPLGDQGGVHRDYYLQLLDRQLRDLSHAGIVGQWRTAVYLHGDDTSYPLLAALWQGLFGGSTDAAECVQVIEEPDARACALAWALPDVPADAITGAYRRPFAAQTILSTDHLSEYVALPEKETPGFAIGAVADFDTDVARRDGIEIGAVLAHGEPTGATYTVEPASMTRHALVAGLTGSGKTNTVFQVLEQLHRAGTPFLVLEPAKTEYRALMRGRLGDDLRVFTLGSERVAPLRINPFELPPGTSVTAHIDLLRAVFAASFSMWPPLPQVFERCLHEIYADRGWDPATGTNVRAPSGEPVPAPTLTDLAVKIGEVVPSLGYPADTRDEIRAALLTRVNGLRGGAKGRMLDVQRGQSIGDLLGGPVVLELESLGDDDDKAFVMGVLLVHLYEWRRGENLTTGLRHVLVVEEAHRLLSVTGGAAEGKDASPKAKFVEAFTQILAEIRAYGQGVLIADQVPVRLAPDVLKNTDLKIIHRIVARDDREAVAAAMAMDDDQAVALTTLPTGRAAVFSGTDDSPVLVAVEKRKSGEAGSIPSHEDVAARYRRSGPSAEALRATVACDETCDTGPAACAWARRAIEIPHLSAVLRRVVHTAVEVPMSLGALWTEVVTVARPLRPAHLPERAALLAIARHGAYALAHREGARAGWPYTVTDAYGAALAAALTAAAAEDLIGVTDMLTGRMAPVQAVIGTRADDWYPRCATICGAAPGECRYRTVVADVRLTRPPDRDWARGLPADADVAALWDQCLLAADEIIDYSSDRRFPEATDYLRGEHRKAALCHAQQTLADAGRRVSGAARDMDRLLALAESATA